MRPRWIPSFISNPRRFFFPFPVLTATNSGLLSPGPQGSILRQDVRNGVIMGNQSLVLQNLHRNASGKYHCLATNDEGTATSNHLRLDIKCELHIGSFFRGDMLDLCGKLRVAKGSESIGRQKAALLARHGAIYKGIGTFGQKTGKEEANGKDNKQFVMQPLHLVQRVHEIPKSAHSSSKVTLPVAMCGTRRRNIYASHLG